MEMTNGITQLGLHRKIDGLLGSSYDLPKVIRKIYREIGRVLDTANFYIATYNHEDNTVSFEIYTIGGEELKVSTRPLAKGMTEHVIRTKRPLRINHRLMYHCRRLGIKPIGKMAKSWLGVPMIYKNNVEGVITVQNYEKENVYSPMHEDFLSSLAARAAVVVANTRLIHGEIRRAKELSLMNQIAHRLTRTLDVDAICQSTTRSILQKFKNFIAAIFLVEGERLLLRKLSAGFRSEVPRNMQMTFGQGIVGSAARQGCTMVANDVTRHPTFLSLGQTSTKSEVAIPLKIARRTIGVLDLQCNKLNAFNPGSVRVLELIADRLSVALHNARLYEDVTNHAKELAVSFAIAKSLISTSKLDAVLSRILQVIRNTFGYANCAILLIDKNRKELYIKAAHGYPIRFWRTTRLNINKKEGITGYVAATGQLFYAPDVSKVPFYAQWKKSVRSEAAVPLKIKGEVIGVLDIESEHLNAFSEKDLRIFSVFASQAAIAIENARLFDETVSLSLTDGLTRIANRRHFDLILESELRKARSYSRPVSLAMIDLDDFKQFNDRFGHPAGDKLLIHIAQMVKAHIRDTDFLARYGGEEFTLILPETNSATSLRVLERIRNTINAASLLPRNRNVPRITVSIGLATYPQNGLAAAELLENADRALYRAKSLGKNRVEIA